MGVNKKTKYPHDSSQLMNAINVDAIVSSETVRKTSKLEEPNRRFQENGQKAGKMHFFSFLFSLVGR